MTKQINVKLTQSEVELQKWLSAQNSVSGSIKLLIKQAIARYGLDIDINDALIKESIAYATLSEHNSKPSSNTKIDNATKDLINT